MTDDRDRAGSGARLANVPLPRPIGALRERVRRLAAALADTRDQVSHGRAEASARFDVLERSLEDLSDEIGRVRRNGASAGSEPKARTGAAPARAGPPEWEYVAAGWDGARDAERQEGLGWDVGAVARAYAAKWPSFLRAIDGPGPLGVGHEVLDGQDVAREDLVAQNIVLSFGYALERAAAVRADPRALASVLDWGGALGHYHELARRLRPDLALDYYVKELPSVCAEGRRVSPDVTFHETGDCLSRRYDLVMASSSLHYADDWRELLRGLASATIGRLYLARVPVVRSAPTYVLRQRAHAYGYRTEYVGWVINRDEVVGAARDAGWELERELILAAPMVVAGAPESPVEVGLLFAPVAGT
jgi:putative methyltransferase (TIGR04325 family)